MARFEVHEVEGVHYVDLVLNNETVRAEAGSLSYLEGNISVHSKLIPSIPGAIKSVLAMQAIYRPTYTGTGVVTLLSSLGGFHIMDLDEESWIRQSHSTGCHQVGRVRSRMGHDLPNPRKRVCMI